MQPLSLNPQAEARALERICRPWGTRLLFHRLSGRPGNSSEDVHFRRKGHEDGADTEMGHDL